jgi:hypothetical protein
MSVPPDSTTPEQLIADLQRQLAERTAERDEALARETATAEVLQVINSSPGNLVPVFDAMLENAMRLCGAVCGGLFTSDGQHFRVVASRGVPQALAEYRAKERPLATNDRSRQLMETRRYVQVVDLTQTDDYRSGDPDDRAAADLGGARTILNVPLLKDDAVVGLFSFFRQEPRAFSDKQIALLENFAAQAVIAIENARLLTETREALERQTATAEVLQVINSSPGDLAPVFDAILQKAHSLCGVEYGSLQLYDGRCFRGVALRGLPPALAELARQPYEPTPQSALGRLVAGERFYEISDQFEREFGRRRAAAEAGIRTCPSSDNSRQI